jgi:organic hydroperoxide reductase OsmC/OhrA
MRHEYIADVIWTGNRGVGTRSYLQYGRDHRIQIVSKPDLLLSADPVFHGDSGKHNPEDLFLGAISGCHMLAYLALCARHGVSVLRYEDHAVAALVTNADGGRFESVVLAPVVTITPESDEELALQLHETANQRCFVARSCSVPIHSEPVIRVLEDAATHTP